jgi:hypothetical protein
MIGHALRTGRGVSSSGRWVRKCEHGGTCIGDREAKDGEGDGVVALAAYARSDGRPISSSG